jgi:cystathionine gamma-synthase
LGGVESLICHPATMTHAGMEPKARLEAGVGDTLIRVSVGIEDINDLLADLERVFQLVKPGQNKNIGLVGKGAGSPEGNVKLSAARPALW